jgi:hypothetical protein
MTNRDRLISRLCAAVRSRGLDCNNAKAVARCVEEHLSEIKADGALYDSLPRSKNNFSNIVKAVVLRSK